MKSLERSHGLGFRGYLASVKRYDAPLEYATDQSLNFNYDPRDRSFERRRGSTILGDTASAGVEVTGILEDKWSARARKMIALDSPSLTTGYPTPCTLYSKENDVNTGHFGALHVHDPSGGSDAEKNYVLGSEYGSSTYPQAGGTLASEAVLKCVPYWYESGEGGMGRCVTALQRRLMFGGARGMVQVGNHLYVSALRSSPIRWNKSFNRTTALTTYRNRIFPWGHIPPLFCPTVTAGTASSGNDYNWMGGDTFYVSVVFQFEDGSYSMPCIPRPITSDLASGFGYVAVNSAGLTSNYRDVAWTDIPIGPAGTVARILLRTPRQRRTTLTDPLTIAPTDLRICGILRNNTATTYTDTLSDDDGLIDDDNIVRFDHVWPKRSRYVAVGDQRVVQLYTLPNPAAIILSVTGSAGSRDLNHPDDNANVYGPVTFYARLTGTDLQLRKESGGITSTTTISLSNITLGQLVDKINATAFGGSGGEWAAQLAPGADFNAFATNLMLTHRTITATPTNASTTLTTAASFADVPVGAVLVGTNIPANTYVVSKASDTSLTMSAAATGSPGAVSVDFSVDTGDDSRVSTTKLGNVRAYCPAFPVVLYFKRSALEGYATPAKQDVWFTISSPGANNSGTSLAANAFVAGNRRTEDASLGIGMGLAGGDEATAVIFSKGWAAFINTRGGNTGEDFDMRMRVKNRARGCCAWGTIVHGDGWFGFLSPQGYVVSDYKDERIISGAVYSSESSMGQWVYEIAQSLQAAMADTDGAYAHAAVLGGQLHISYRSSSSFSTYNNRRLVYDFAQGIASSGLGEILDGDQQPFGWGTPLSQRFGPMVEVVTSGVSNTIGKPLRFGAVEANAGGTGDGRIDQFDTTMADNGVTITALLYTCTDSFGTLRKKSLHRVIGRYRNADNVLALTIYGNIARTVSQAVALTGTDTEYSREVIEADATMRDMRDIVELLWTSTAGSAVPCKVWGGLLEGHIQDASYN